MNSNNNNDNIINTNPIAKRYDSSLIKSIALYLAEQKVTTTIIIEIIITANIRYFSYTMSKSSTTNYGRDRLYHHQSHLNRHQ